LFVGRRNITQNSHITMQCSFCGGCFTVVVGRNERRRRLKRMCTSALPHYNLSHSEIAQEILT
jgi:hypothetical protein